MQFTIRRLFISFTNAIIAVVCVSCVGSKDKESESNLNVAVSVEIASLDPQTTTSVDAIKIQSALFETLCRIDATTGAIVPAGALRWEILDEGKTYRFELNPALQWSDGERLTSTDFEYAFERLMRPELGAPFADLYFCIQGAESRFHQDDFGSPCFGVKAVSDTILEIRLSYAVPYFLTLLARPCAAALPEHHLAHTSAEISRTDGWSLQPGFPSSGPYVLEDWQVNRHILLRKNPEYYQADQIDFETIHFFSIESPYAQEQGFKSRALDVTSVLASERIASFEGDPVFTSQLEMGTFYVITNTQSDRLKQRLTRRALSRTIDREVIVKKLRQRGELIATSFSPPLWEGYHPMTGVIDDANNEIDQLKRGEIGKLRFLVSSSAGNLQIAEALQAMWTEALGVEVEIVRQEWKSYLDSRKRGNFDLCLATWIGDYFDPLTFLEMWKSSAVNNYSRWKNEDYDRLLLAAESTAEPKARFELLEAAEQKLMSEVPILPVFYLSRVYLKSDTIEIWPQTILNTVDYTKVRRK